MSITEAGRERSRSAGTFRHADRIPITVAGFSDHDLQQAMASAAGGGLVYLPPGTYRLEQTIALPSDLSLVGAGPGSTHLVLDPALRGPALTNADHHGDERIELRGFSIDGGMTDGATSAVHLENVRGIDLRSVDAHHFGETALRFDSCSGVTVTDVALTAMGSGGMAATMSADVVLRRVSLSGAGLVAPHPGIRLDGCAGAQVDVEVADCRGAAIMLDSTSGPLSDVIMRSSGSHSTQGLAITGTPEHALSNVCIAGDYSHNRECGILVSDASSVLIVGASASSNGEQGILLDGGDGARRCVIADCHLTDNPVAVLERGSSGENYQTGTWPG